MAIADIVAYIETNKRTFSFDELISQLRASGYPETEIQEALKRIKSSEASVSISVAREMDDPKPGKKITSWIVGFLSAFILNGAIVAAGILLFLFYAFGGFRRNYTIPLIIMAVGAALIAGEILFAVKLRKRFPYVIRGLVAGVVGLFLLGGFSYGYMQLRYKFFSSYRVAQERQYVSDMHSRDARRITDIKQLQLALELYFDAKKDYPNALYELAPSYIPSIPVDPYGIPYSYEKRGPRHYYLAAQLEDYRNPVLVNDVNPGDIWYEVEVGAAIVIPRK